VKFEKYVLSTLLKACNMDNIPVWCPAYRLEYHILPIWDLEVDMCRR